MARIQPSYKVFWHRVHVGVKDGLPLSTFLSEIWPDEFVRAVKSGEDSAKMSETFQNIERIIIVKQEISKEISGVLYPLGILFAGLGAFIFYMTAVIPSMAKMLKGDDSSVMQLSLWMEATAHEYGYFILLGLAVGIAWIVYLINQDSFRKTLLNAMFYVPLIKEPLYKLHFGIWSAYVALMTDAGLSVIETITKTKDILPEKPSEMMNSVLVDIRDRNTSMTEAVTVFSQEDLRQEMPHYVASAFQIADQTGILSSELSRVSPLMVLEGKKSLSKIIKAANLLAMLISAILVVTPLGIYYMKIIDVASSMG
jgi:type II secretory pathway component PulF